MAGLTHSAEFGTLALMPLSASDDLARRTLASAGLSGRVGLNLWQMDAAVARQ